MKDMNRRTFLLLVPILVALLAATGCQQKTGGKVRTINVGVVLPMTGDLATYGAPMKAGIELALEDINKATDSLKFGTVYVDSKADPSTALSGLNKLLSLDNARYIIGDVSSPVTLAMVPVIENNKAFLLSPGASSPKLNNISPWFARNYPSSVAESEKSAEFLFQVKQIREAAIVYVSSEFGLGLRDMFEKTYQNLGGKVVLSLPYESGRTDFRPLILKVKSVQPKAIYLGGNQKEMGNFMRQFKESGLSSIIISNISFLQPDCLNIAGKSADGVLVPVAYYNPQDSTMSGAYAFAKEFRMKYKKDPSILEAVGFDAINLIASGVRRLGDNPKEVADFIRNLAEYDGALGKLRFKEGDVQMPIVFKVVKDGKAEEMK